MSKIRYVVVGCGGYNNNYMIPNLRGHAETELAGVVDVARERAEAAREAWGDARLPVFTDFREALRQLQPDLALVHTNLSSHYANCRNALEAGCHVSVAKPFVETIAQARELAALSRQTGRFVSVQQNARLGHAERIKEWIEDGTVGPLRYGQHNTFRDRWHGLAEYQITEDWPVINATLIHLVDQARFWTGQNFVRAAFRGVHVPWSPYRDPGAVSGWWETREGFMLSVFQSYVSRLVNNPAHHPFENYHLQGDQAALTWTGPWGQGAVHLLSPAEPAPREVIPAKADFGNVVAQMMDKLVASIREGAPVFCSAEDNLQSLAAMKAAELSARRGGAVVETAEVL